MSTFKIKGPIPNSESDIETLADYFEVQALCAKNSEISLEGVLKQFIKSSDEIHFDGIEDKEDLISTKLEAVSGAIQRRMTCSKGNYPFSTKFNGNVVAFEGFKSFPSYLYVYLLLATRLNMSENKKFANIDGTQLFEEISALVAKQYFGDRSDSMVFGTAVKGNFENKINEMCQKMQEGGAFMNHNGGDITENDDALDVVVWKHFEDKLPNKLIGFGQCKTGTSYESHRNDLQPANFCKKWIQIQFNQEPVRLFFIADVVEKDKFWKRSVDAGILFDRIRIMDYLPQVNPDLERNICSWSEKAMHFACN